MHKFIKYALFALGGSFILSAASSVQKMISGFSFTPASFIIPVVFGGIFGVMLRWMYCAIVELKITQNKLLESERHFKTLVNVARDAIFLVDDQGRFVDVNTAACSMLGRTREEMLSFYLWDIDASFNKEAFFAFWEQGFDSTPRLFETNHLRADGSILTVEVNGFILYENDARYYYGLARDVTGRKQAEEAIKASEQRFRNLLSNVDMVPVQGYDVDRRVIYWNKASEQFYGYSEQEAMGVRLEDLLIPESRRDEVVWLVTDWIENGIPMPAGEQELLCKDGSLVYVYSSHVMQENTSNEKEIYCVAVELSEIKAVQDELRFAKEMAESANLAKSEFLANMSHEIRTPLNGILGMLQLMKSPCLESERIDYIDLAIQSSRRLNRLLTDILDLSQVEAGKLFVQNEHLNLDETVRDACEMFRPVSEKSGLALTSYVCPKIPAQLLGDVTRLQQVLINLVGNAIKFTEQGSIFVEAYPLPTELVGKVRVLFSVSDTGIGMPEKQLDSLFDAFTQASQGATRRYQGAGLGLAICKRLIKLMGGNMAVSSEPGKGTTMHFCITFGVEESEIVPAQLSLDPQAIEISNSGGHILLAEDEVVNQLMAKRLLEKQGHRVTAVENGREVLATLRGGGLRSGGYGRADAGHGRNGDHQGYP